MTKDEIIIAQRIPDEISGQLERADWEPKEALQFYADGNHFDVVDGKTRILDTGGIASNALKSLSIDRLELKGDAELHELREKVIAQQARIEQLLNFIKHAQVSSGVCCCGDSMEEHPSPMYCGHSPVDMWDYHSAKLLEAISDDLSALRAHDAAIWREAAAVCRHEGSFGRPSYEAEAACKARAEAIEKGGDK